MIIKRRVESEKPPNTALETDQNGRLACALAAQLSRSTADMEHRPPVPVATPLPSRCGSTLLRISTATGYLLRFGEELDEPGMFYLQGKD